MNVKDEFDLLILVMPPNTSCVVVVVMIIISLLHMVWGVHEIHQLSPSLFGMSQVLEWQTKLGEGSARSTPKLVLLAIQLGIKFQHGICWLFQCKVQTTIIPLALLFATREERDYSWICSRTASFVMCCDECIPLIILGALQSRPNNDNNNE